MLRSLSTLTTVLTLTIMGVALAPAATAHACSCLLEDREPAFEGAVSVFEGRVMGYEQSEGADGTGPTSAQVTVNVVRTWKGANSETLVLRTAGNGAMCGYAVEVGSSHLFYTHRPEGSDEEWVGLCSRSSLVTSEQARADIRAMGAGVTPVDPEGGTEDPPPAVDGVLPLEERAAGDTEGSTDTTVTPGAASEENEGSAAAPPAVNGSSGGCASCNVNGGSKEPPLLIFGVIIAAFAQRRRQR